MDVIIAFQFTYLVCGNLSMTDDGYSKYGEFVTRLLYYAIRRIATRCS